MRLYRILDASIDHPDWKNENTSVNSWQRLKGTVPLGVPEEQEEQTELDLSFHDFGIELNNNGVQVNKTPRCKVYDWRLNNSVLFETLGKEAW